jgi:hypothetical protein
MLLSKREQTMNDEIDPALLDRWYNENYSEE